MWKLDVTFLFIYFTLFRVESKQLFQLLSSFFNKQDINKIITAIDFFSANGVLKFKWIVKI